MTFQILEVPGVLSRAECEQLILRFGPLLERSQVGHAHARSVHPARTSSSLKISAEHVPASLRARVVLLSGQPVTHQEAWEITRYREGEQFRPHYDLRREAHPGLCRLFTALVCLRVPEAGGRTLFPAELRTITPELGKLLLWPNASKHGARLAASLHGSEAVTRGEKWILATWVHPRAVP